jgi:Uma2 family endonuclease
MLLSGQPFVVFGLHRSMSTAQSRVKPDAAVLHDIDWGTYTTLLRAFEGRRHFRLTYDRGTLEIRSPLWEHERPAYILGRFIDVITDELQLPCEPGRTVTLRRRRKSRGLEPDNCYWIACAERLAGKTRLDLRVDPPPDLAIEMDVTHSSLDRMSIYAALGVPEVWRVTSEGLTFNILESGIYQGRPRSLSFPQLASADLVAFLAQLGSTGTTALVAQFRDWVRQVRLHRPN